MIPVRYKPGRSHKIETGFLVLHRLLMLELKRQPGRSHTHRRVSKQVTIALRFEYDRHL
ncbi:hypothetical protein QUA40_02905 [Microcoleus sp. Pol11C3]|uniref:hypothetical protein n=1 Tax=Microcoleus sp. Pol11C3 TaxID=3055390 RepID=UPI002FD3B48B